MIGYDDKRKFYRMMINSPCKLSLMDAPTSASLQAICRDISATGMLLEVEHNNLSLGTKVQVQIESSNEQFPSLSATATVVRVEPADNNVCVLGVEIIDMH